MKALINNYFFYNILLCMLSSHVIVGMETRSVALNKDIITAFTKHYTDTEATCYPFGSPPSDILTISSTLPCVPIAFTASGDTANQPIAPQPNGNNLPNPQFWLQDHFIHSYTLRSSDDIECT